MLLLAVIGLIKGSWDRAIIIHEETAEFMRYVMDRSRLANPVARGFSINSEIVSGELMELARRSHERSGIGAFIFANMSGEPTDTIVLSALAGDKGGSYCPNSIIHECWSCLYRGTAATICVFLHETANGMCTYGCYPCPDEPNDCNAFFD